MYKKIKKSDLNKSQAAANSVTQKKSTVKKGFDLVDNRSEAVTQRKLQKVVHTTSPKTIQKKSNAVIQFAEPQDSSEVIKKYFYNTYQHYGKALIERVCTEKNMRVHAHGSGKPGDGINAATQQEMDNLLPFLQAAKRAVPRVQAPAKKKPKDKSRRHNKVEAAAAAAKKKADAAKKAAAKRAAYLARQ